MPFFFMSSVHRRPRSKYWHAAWRDASGKLHMRSTKQTSRSKAEEVARGWQFTEDAVRSNAQAQKVVSQILERTTGQSLPTHTVREWFTKWLSGKKEETCKRYTGVANAFYVHLGPRADRQLREVMPKDVEAYIDEMKAAKASDKTIQLHLQALKSAFSHAVKMQVLETNPADPVTFTVTHEEERELFTPAEATKIIDAATGEWKTLIRIGYYTGLRLTTAASLKKTAISMQGADGRPVIIVPKPGKRAKAVTIPAHEDLVQSLADALAASPENEEYLLPQLAGSESGGKRGLSRAFRQIVVRAGIDMMEITRPNGHKFAKRSFHSLRHGSVSGMANAGVSPELRKEMTGHKTDREHARYTHLQTETLREAANKIPKLPAGTGAPATATPSKPVPEA